MSTLATIAHRYGLEVYALQAFADMNDVSHHEELTDEQEVFVIDLLDSAGTDGVYDDGTNTLRMDGGELQSVREYLGLTIESLAGMLRVNPRTVRSWESGRDNIPERIREDVEHIEAYTAKAVGDVVAGLMDASHLVVLVYRRDEDMHAARPDTAYLPARWWRHVVMRACAEVPGVIVRTA